jgi:outer membrane protein assembly factor BamB
MKKILIVFCCVFLFGSCISLGKTIKPSQPPLLNEYPEQALDDFQHFGQSRSIYGKEITYLGQTETEKGYHQIYIQSTPRATLYEQRDNMISSEAYSCEFIALRVNESEKGGLEWGSACIEQWSYQLTGVNIQSICFDKKYVYVSTGKGPEWKFYEGEYCVLCFEKETGKNIWKKVIPGPVESPFYVWNHSLLFSIFDYHGNQMIEMDKIDGSILGTYDESIIGLQIQDAVYLASINKEKGPILEQYSLQTKTSEIVWYDENSKQSEELLQTLVSSPIQVQNWLCFATSYCFSDQSTQCFLYAYNINTQSIDWSMDLGVEGRIHKLFFDRTYLYALQYGASCTAIDPFTQTEKWQTTFEGYRSNQIVPYKNRIYMVVSSFKVIAREGVEFDHKTLYLDKETGELDIVAPPSYFTGIGGVEGILAGQYDDYLITQGPYRTYLELYRIVE